MGGGYGYLVLVVGEDHMALIQVLLDDRDFALSSDSEFVELRLVE